jgi:hypothetical protein
MKYHPGTTTVEHPGTTTVEHATLVSEPQSLFLGHVTPTAGDSKTIASSILDFVKRKEIALDQLVGLDVMARMVIRVH